MVSAEILPASLEISTQEISFLEPVADSLKNEEIVEEVSFQKDIAKVLQDLTSKLRLFGLGLISFLSVVSLLVVLVVISMKAAVRRREVKTMQLLGADSWYIRAPFLMEGIFYGLAGAFLAWGITYLVLLYSTPFLINFLTGISLLPVPFEFMLLLLLGLVGGGALIGSLGSFIAVRRYLK